MSIDYMSGIMSKKNIYSIVLIVVVALTLSAWIIIDSQNTVASLQVRNNGLKSQTTAYKNQTTDLQNQVSQLQAQTNYLQTQINDFQGLLQNQTKIVKIVDFSLNLSEARGLLPSTIGLQVTFKNLGISDVENITMVVRMFNDGSEVDKETLTLNALHVEEEQSMNVTLFTPSYPGGAVYMISLMTGDLVLDEITL